MNGVPIHWKSYKNEEYSSTVKKGKNTKNANDFLRENVNMMFTYSLNKVTLFEIEINNSFQYVPYNDNVDTIHMVGFL